jgi:uncharacterized membrane protein YgaE (UPF0421/DUF939 family)
MAEHLSRPRAVFRREAHYVRDQVAGLRERDSTQRFEVRQIAKATLAAALAWFLAERMLTAAEAVWMAPATAVIMVHATVYQTFTNGVRRVIAVAAGVILAGSVGHLLGLNVLSLVLVVPPALVAGRWHRMGDHRSDVATTAVLMLSFGAGSQNRYLLGYVMATAVGALVGGVVNAVLWPPLYRRRTSLAVRRLGKESAGLLAKVAAGLRAECDLSDLPEWERHAIWLDTHLTRATSAIADGAESRRYNLRRYRLRRADLRSDSLRRIRKPAPRDHAPSVRALEQIGVHVHTIVRALDQVNRRRQQVQGTGGAWISLEFVCDYADLLDLLAQVIDAQTCRPGDTADISALLAQSLQLATTIAGLMTDQVRAGEVDHPRGWAASGSLFTDAERIIAILMLLNDPELPSLTDPAATADHRADASASP